METSTVPAVQYLHTLLATKEDSVAKSVDSLLDILTAGLAQPVTIFGLHGLP